MTQSPNKRGFDLDEFPGSFRLASVNADADEVSRTLAEHLGTECKSGVGRVIDDSGGISVFQFAEQTWSGLVPLTLPYDRVLAYESLGALSQQLDTTVLSLEHQDTSGWSVFRVYQGGELVEEYEWGLDYSEEMAEVGVDLEVLAGEWDLCVSAGDELAPEQFKFRSSRRTIDEALATDPQRLLDTTYREFDAWQPSWDTIYAADENVLARANLVAPE